ncbi:MAG: peptidylprolyl isomerase [Clostridia bacterium]|nr:peptidylprolyl isomerase [Clostridia bacterium]
MKRLMAWLMTLCLLAACAGGMAEEQTEEHPVVRIEIENWGTIYAELYPEIAPISVENFLSLVDRGFYDGLTFHRIISGFMIQGGWGSEDLPTIKGEFSANGVENPLLHERGVLSMARTSVMDSATSQFFIMHETSPHLDGQYAAFGRVLAGMPVVDRICGMTPVTDNNGSVAAADQPVIRTIARADRGDAEAAAADEALNGQSGRLFRDAATTVSFVVPQGWNLAASRSGASYFVDEAQHVAVVATMDYWSRLPQEERLQAQVGGLTREGLKTEVIRTEVLAGWIGVEEALLVPEEHNGISFYTAEDPEQGLYWVGLDNGIIIMALTTTEGADAVREMLDSLSAVQR